MSLYIKFDEPRGSEGCLEERISGAVEKRSQLRNEKSSGSLPMARDSQPINQQNLGTQALQRFVGGFARNDKEI
jgi:hypothetical protein